ncbi:MULTISPECIES: 1-phosphofructokinase [unclassified Pseudomonas]|uniref:1-phosphofructokinase n=1 Tax=unclassified Pseudomonas TaxID=196821 RepID=UPI0012951970|nr:MULTISPECIES: 1-phosphofructokinase [unclassified Pseudomonas]MQT42072.1 1-phosphofructokinase [Pseudomonas sp. FSL R10-0765]MQT55469.1 1-phosphofructokinase [Pseudomonas sp. FSL R10-2398]MQT98937.1 1-phosphofructokinase [Pseudomonas sp. FSL R10-2245]MQU09805.1 1-phosphofructokinase [Pseudomonas sp. FSL R10-2189]MQU36251.1 1-phosphofructokinase [Pseudomonas sp. FSL R10-2172]
MARILTITLNPALDLTVRVPHLEPGEVNRSQALLSHAAGKGLNVAQVLADLGHSLTVSGFLGEDNQQAFNALFARRGFADAFIRVPGETRSNIKLAEDDGRVTDINGPGPHVNDLAQHALLDKLDHIAASHDAVVVAGSLPRGVSAQWLRELVLRLKALGCKVILDTSGEALKEGLRAGPWLVKPNAEELSEALGHPVSSVASQVAAATELQTLGISHVVISHGADGVNWFSRGTQPLQALPPKVRVASTVGAGDSLLAGMVHGLISGHSPEQTLRSATAIAALAVTQIGFGISDALQLVTLESGVNVRALAQE